MDLKTIFLLLIFSFVFAKEPISPIPKKMKYNHKKAELGKILFSDPMLSSDGTISCFSCHSFEHGGADPRAVSIGVTHKKGCANAPTVYNSYFNFRQFWNGRAKDLKAQAGGPLHNPVEMGMDKAKIDRYLKGALYYKKTFQILYHKSPNYADALDAIAEFEKALYTPNAKFDRYLRGEVKLSEKESKGYKLFKKAGCIVCHNGINIGSNSYEKMGLIFPYKWKKGIPDLYALTKKEQDKNVFKVPTLRNIALTAPYFHDGGSKNLDEALKNMAYHNLGTKFSKEQIEELKSFLHTLTGQKPSILMDN